MFRKLVIFVELISSLTSDILWSRICAQNIVTVQYVTSIYTATKFPHYKA